MNMKMVDLEEKSLPKHLVPEPENETSDAHSTTADDSTKVEPTTSQTVDINVPFENTEADLCGACSTLEEGPLPMYGPVARPSHFEDSHYGKDIVDISAEQGIVGMYNLGNTCFMNAGLQCLFSIPRLMRFFHRDFDDTNVPYASLTYHFYQVLSKVWSGQFTILCPKEFKNLLSAYHPQFQDYRQHDCQELLALLLDTLHEQLNEGNASEKCAKALEEGEASRMDETVSGGRQQSVQSEDSEMLGSDSQSGTHTPADRSASQSPVEQANNHPDNSNIVHSLSVTTNQNAGNTITQNKLQLFVSEDSNQSETSYQSSELLPSEDHEQRMKPIPEEMKADSEMMVVGEDLISPFKPIVEPETIVGMTTEADSSSDCIADAPTSASNSERTPEDATSSTASPEKRLSLEDFYMKDTKTLNLNVLAEEYMHEEVATDSEKFHKHENNVDRPATDPFETLSDFIMNEVKSPTSKPLKDSNLLANFKEKFDPQHEGAFPKKCLFSDIKNLRGEEEADWDEAATSSTVTGFCSINNIKRMKVDEDEKNVRMQARLKVNTNKMSPSSASTSTAATLTGSDEISNIRLLSPSDNYHHHQGARGEGDNNTVNANTLLLNNPRTAADTTTSPLEEQMRAQNLAEAERAWKKYLEGNRSIVVDTFQGQFKSTVVCSECDHVSVTYEPFMYLSVPLPHAMERQISVIFLPSDNKQPVRYLITLNKTGSVKKLKTRLLELIGEESVDIVIAEVFDNHISRILDDGTQLRYMNDYNREIYAFEMLPPPLVEEEISGNISDDTSTITTSDATSHGSTDTLIGATNNCTVSSGSLGVVNMDDNNFQQSSYMDITSSFGDVATSTTGGGVHRSASEPTFVTNNHKVSTTSVPDSRELDSAHILNNFGSGGAEQGWDTGFDAVDRPPSPSLLESQTGFLNNFPENMCTSTTSTGMDFEVKKDCEDGEWDAGQDNEVTSTGGNYGSTGGTPQQDPLEGLDLCGPGAPGVTVGGVTDTWKSCAICLEDMSDSELMVHTACGGTLCPSCLEMSCKHYGESSFICPVCSSPVHPADDFVQLSDAVGYKPKNRILSVPIVYRTVQPSPASSPPGGGESPADSKPRLFGHPNILYLSSNTTGETLYETVDRVVPCFATYSIVLTDGQGLHCSRCMYTSHCGGCEVPRLGEVKLQPGDHLAVCFSDLSAEQIEVARAYTDHRSMQELRAKDYLTLFDCFHAFTDSETLDEHNPWYCPQCKQNQCARKTITVWRYPETLVIYLKRFVFHELSSSKIDNKVIFPLENLDLSEFISGPITNKMFYDLQSCVCHFGGVNAGHYTSYAKHPVTKQWHYFNDETTSAQAPQDDDYSNAYILFYQRQGTNIDLNVPEKCHMVAPLKPRGSVSEECAGVDKPSTGGAQFDTDEVTSQLLKILQSNNDGTATQDETGGDTRDPYGGNPPGGTPPSPSSTWDKQSRDPNESCDNHVGKSADSSSFEFYS